MSGLDYQTIPLPLDGGTDTKTDSKQLEPVKMALVQDGFFQTPKKVRKRYGYTALSNSIYGGGTISSGQGIFSNGNELGILSNNTVYSYQPSLGQWVNKNAGVAPITVNRFDVGTDNGSLENECCVCNNIAFFARFNTFTFFNGVTNVTGTTPYVNAYDVTTGKYITTLIPTTATNFNNSLRMVTTGNFVFLFYVDANASPSTLRAHKLDTTNLTGGLSVATLVATDIPGGASATYDVAVYNGNIYVSWFSSTAATGPRVIELNTSLGTVNGPTSFALSPSATTSGSAYLFPDVGNSQIYLYCSYAVSGTQKSSYFVINGSLGTITGQTNLTTPAIGAAIVSGFVRNNILVLIAGNQTLQGTQWTTAQLTGTGTLLWASVAGGAVKQNWTTTSMPQLSLDTKAFTLNGLDYVGLAYYDPFDGQQLIYQVLVNSSTGAVTFQLAARSAHGTYCSTTFFPFPKSIAATGGTGQFLHGGFIMTLVHVTFTGTANTATNVSWTNSWISCGQLITIGNNLAQPTFIQNDKNTLIGGGAVFTYDGISVVENTALFPPWIVSATVSAGTMPVGTYTYYVVYEYLDANGQWHRSEPSLPYTFTSNGSQKVSLVLSPYANLGLNQQVPGQTFTLTQPQAGQLYATVYRTTVNGTVAHKLSNTLIGFTQTTTVPGSTFLDNNTADATISGNTVLYTSGGVLPNIEISNCQQFELSQSRVFMLGDDPYTAFYSKTHVNGEPVDMSELLAVLFPQADGALTGIKWMDDKTIFMKVARPYVMYGDGPDDTGANNTFSTPQPVNCPAGCDNPKSLVSIPSGIIFKSKVKGFWQLDRALNSTYIGAEVEAYNSFDVTSALLVPNTTQVRFTLSNGVALTFDYLTGKWAVNSNVNAVGACIWNNQYIYLQSNGTVMYEDPSNFRDGTTAISMNLTTGWVNVGNLQGFKRIRAVNLLGDYKSGHTLTVQIGYDYENAYTQTEVITPDKVVSVAPNNDVYQFKIPLLRHKCEAFRLNIFDTATGTPGEGYSLSGMEVEVGLKKGNFKLPASKVFG